MACIFLIKIFFVLSFVLLSFTRIYLGFVAVQYLSHVWLFVTPWTAACQASLSFTIPWVCSVSCSLSQWCHPTISSSVVSFSSCPQSFPASGSFPVSRLLASGGQSIGASDSASVFPVNIHSRFPLGLTGLISFQPKGLSRESSPAPQFKSINSLALSLCYSPTLTFCTWLLEKP